MGVPITTQDPSRCLCMKAHLFMLQQVAHEWALFVCSMTFQDDKSGTWISEGTKGHMFYMVRCKMSWMTWILQWSNNIRCWAMTVFLTDSPKKNDDNITCCPYIALVLDPKGSRSCTILCPCSKMVQPERYKYNGSCPDTIVRPCSKLGRAQWYKWNCSCPQTQQLVHECTRLCSRCSKMYGVTLKEVVFAYSMTSGAHMYVTWMSQEPREERFIWYDTRFYESCESCYASNNSRCWTMTILLTGSPNDYVDNIMCCRCLAVCCNVMDPKWSHGPVLKCMYVCVSMHLLPCTDSWCAWAMQQRGPLLTRPSWMSAHTCVCPWAYLYVVSMTCIWVWVQVCVVVYVSYCHASNNKHMLFALLTIRGNWQRPHAPMVAHQIQHLDANATWLRLAVGGIMSSLYRYKGYIFLYPGYKGMESRYKQHFLSPRHEATSDFQNNYISNIPSSLMFRFSLWVLK
jgi:hypothetical protein